MRFLAMAAAAVFACGLAAFAAEGLPPPDLNAGHPEAPAPAVPGEAHEGQHAAKSPEASLKEILEGLGLNDEQKEKIRAAHAEAREKEKAAKETISRLQKELIRLVADKGADDKEIEEKIEAYAQAHAEAAKAHVEIARTLRGVLTGEQLKALAERLEAKHAKPEGEGHESAAPPEDRPDTGGGHGHGEPAP